MIKKMTNASVRMVERLLPDAFIFCVVLTIVAFIFAMLGTGQSVMQMVVHWGNGVWGLLGFSMQMALVLVLGNALASSKPIKKVLKSIASVAKTPTQAIMLVSFVSAIACWINWGFGLIVGALLAKELARKVRGVDYRLLIASAYSGFVVWHNGISGSMPLQVASDAKQLETFSGGLIKDLIKVDRTLFSVQNLVIVAIIIFTLPIINKLMHPDPDQVVTIDPSLLEDEEEYMPKPRKERTPAEKLENSFIITYSIVFMGLAYLVWHFMTKGFDLNLNIVNLIFLVLGMAFHKTPINYVMAINEAVKGAGGIIIQFPFYAGIMGIMTGKMEGGVSLAEQISNWFVSVSNANTFPVFTFWSAGIVNFFVPSGGGQWAVQGPIMLKSSVLLGVDPAKTVLALSWGDAWTNMIQPFWALPALGVAKLGAKDIMGYCLMVLLYTGIIISLLLYLF